MTHRSSPSSRELPTLGLLLDLAAAAVVFSDLPEPPLPLPPDSGSRICAESAEPCGPGEGSGSIVSPKSVGTASGWLHRATITTRS
ncbi:hypothetical protein B296_00033895 [Ensete ventricosum]|uniref:Secreted protein n=1 Tax=Ensete ventricosum TaxID=4639 RepID=A0A427A3Q5_ENSVE|nr:hypothetical protein B296_00033895 [Ensete ventricosum]